jgi:hypothetical protein
MAHNGTGQTQKLLAPGIELPRADPVFARDLGWRQIRPQALANDLALLLHGPGPTPINRAEDLPRRDASARKTNLTSVLSRESQVRRQSIHPKIGSQNAYPPPDGAVATLTRNVVAAILVQLERHRRHPKVRRGVISLRQPCPRRYRRIHAPRWRPPNLVATCTSVISEQGRTLSGKSCPNTCCVDRHTTLPKQALLRSNPLA